MFDLFSLFFDSFVGSYDVGDLEDTTSGLGSLFPNQSHGLNFNYMGDWDHDGIPNYADHWYGPGAQNPGYMLGSFDNIDDAGMTATVIEDVNVIDVPGLDSSSDSVLGDRIFGEPYEVLQYWSPQESDFSCAIASQKALLESITGLDIPELQLAEFAFNNGWFDPNCGTLPANVGNILEYYGIEVVRTYDQTIDDLIGCLNQGDKVLVALDANEIWTPQYDNNGVPLEQNDAGHVVWVTGIHQYDDGNIEIILNDTGNPSGAGAVVQIKDFMNAWNDYGNYAVIANT